MAENPRYAPQNHAPREFAVSVAPTSVQRKITEIRVFYDDQTWESFTPKKLNLLLFAFFAENITPGIVCL
jgi:hypothetical protein